MRAWNWNVTDSKKTIFDLIDMFHDFVRCKSVAETWGLGCIVQAYALVWELADLYKFAELCHLAVASAQFCKKFPEWQKDSYVVNTEEPFTKINGSSVLGTCLKRHNQAKIIKK